MSCAWLAYELRMASAAEIPAPRAEKLATLEDIEGLYAHLEAAAVKSGFYVPDSGSRLPERLRRLFSRVPAMEREEVNILRGLLKALLAQ
jgi:tRNA/rRNA methyltransferase